MYQSLPADGDPSACGQGGGWTGSAWPRRATTAFFTYAQAVYDTQSQLTPETGDQTLNAAITKAGADPAGVTACAATPEAKSAVSASVKLAEDLAINQTPTLMINGRPIPLGGLPYETLRQIVYFQATLDGVKLPPIVPTTK